MTCDVPFEAVVVVKPQSKETSHLFATAVSDMRLFGSYYRYRAKEIIFIFAIIFVFTVSILQMFAIPNR